jgi:hypothetical protein
LLLTDFQADIGPAIRAALTAFGHTVQVLGMPARVTKEDIEGK